MQFTTILLILLFTFQQSFPQRVASLNDTGNIPFELLKEKIIIPVQIKGKTYRFLVDTGGIFEISEDLQKKFGFNQTTSTTITDINKIEVELKTVIVPEIKLGNWTFKSRKAIVSNLHSRYPYSSPLTKFLSDFLMGFYLLNRCLNPATNFILTRGYWH